MINKIKIGIIGRAGSGKDTVAGILKDQIPECQILRFADTLRAYSGSNERNTLVNLGNEIRSNDSYFIIKRTLERANGHVIISDVRTYREYQVLKANGFIFLKITATPDTRLKRLNERDKKNFTYSDLAVLDNSILEKELADVTAIEIENNADKETLEKSLFKALDKLKSPLLFNHQKIISLKTEMAETIEPLEKLPVYQMTIDNNPDGVELLCLLSDYIYTLSDICDLTIEDNEYIVEASKILARSVNINDSRFLCETVEYIRDFYKKPEIENNIKYIVDNVNNLNSFEKIHRFSEATDKLMKSCLTHCCV